MNLFNNYVFKLIYENWVIIKIYWKAATNFLEQGKICYILRLILELIIRFDKKNWISFKWHESNVNELKVE